MGYVEDFTRLLALSIDAAGQLITSGKASVVRYYAAEFAGQIFVGYASDGSLRAVLDSGRFRPQGYRVTADGQWSAFAEIDRKIVVSPSTLKKVEKVARNLYSRTSPPPPKPPSTSALRQAKERVAFAMHESQMPKPPAPYDVWHDYLRDGWRLKPEESRAHDRFCGAHSGFRPCCVRFFTTAWGRMNHQERTVWHTKVAEVYKGKTRYIPCPTCLEKRRPAVRLKTCDCAKIMDRGIKEWRAVIRAALIAYRNGRDSAAFKASMKKAAEVRAKFVADVI